MKLTTQKQTSLQIYEENVKPAFFIVRLKSIFYAFLSKDDDAESIHSDLQRGLDGQDVYDTHNIEHRTGPVSH